MADVTTLWSRTSDFSAAVADFPCVTEKSLWDSEADATNFYGLNGTYVNSDNSGTAVFTFADGKIATTDTSGVLVGMYAYLDGLTAGTNGNGYYEITAVDPNVSITVDGFADLSGVTGLDTDDTCSYYVGGLSDAFDGSTTLQAEFDAAGNDYANGVNNVDILCHASTATTLTATLDIDNITGSASTVVKILAKSSDFTTADTSEWLCGASPDLSTGVVVMGAIRNVQLFGIDINADSKADYAISTAATAQHGQENRYENCVFRGAKLDGVFFRSINVVMLDCVARNNGGDGFKTNPFTAGWNVRSCTAYANGVHGFNLRFTAASCLIDCIAYGNGTGASSGNGFNSTSSMTGVVYDGCVASDNYGDGFVLNLASKIISMTNCSSIGHTNAGNGDGFNLGGISSGELIQFSNNHAYSNKAHYSAGANSTFTDFSGGSNLGDTGDTIDPKFGNPSAGDFIPASDSPLIDAGVGGTGDTVGALCATAGGGGGTTGISKSRAFGGI